MIHLGPKQEKWLAHLRQSKHRPAKHLTGHRAGAFSTPFAYLFEAVGQADDALRCEMLPYAVWYPMKLRGFNAKLKHPVHLSPIQVIDSHGVYNGVRPFDNLLGVWEGSRISTFKDFADFIWENKDDIFAGSA